MIPAVSERVAARLRDTSLLQPAGHIAGKWVSEAFASLFDVRNPSSAEQIAFLPEMGRAETEQAIDAAYGAQPDWRAHTGKERAEFLRRMHDLIVLNAEDLATIVTLESGKPISQARGEVAYAASYFAWFAEQAKRIEGEVIPGHRRDARILVVREPVGVAGLITPWNFPIAMIARKLAPALAAGCTAVLKPSELTPLSAIALVSLTTRAKLPDGAVNLIVGTDSAAIGEAMCASEKMRKISFTGSTAVGRTLMRQSADRVLRLSLELGGNAPFIVFDDADLDRAVEGLIAAKFRNSGQTCVSANRVFVQSSIYKTFAKKLAKAVGDLRVGDGFGENVSIGPLINARTVAKVEEHIHDALSKGASIMAGGTTSEMGPLFYQPTVLADVPTSSQLMLEETFGPVAPLISFNDEAEVVDWANDTEYGLAAYFFTADLSRVWRLAEVLECGMVGVNTGAISDETVPFGGIKQSGLGREGGRTGLDDYLELKYICVGGIQG